MRSEPHDPITSQKSISWQPSLLTHEPFGAHFRFKPEKLGFHIAHSLSPPVLR
jgi:hypothetical protein